MPDQLDMFQTPPGHANVELLVRTLEGRDWTTARQLLAEWGLPATEARRRWLRSLADASAGRVAGGQRGYKLVRAMTAEEFHHFRNWILHQADEMRRRVLEADRVFYRRHQPR